MQETIMSTSVEMTEEELNQMIGLLDRVTTKGIQEAMILIKLVNKMEVALNEIDFGRQELMRQMAEPKPKPPKEAKQNIEKKKK